MSTDDIAFLSGRRAKITYLVLLELATFLAFLTISPSWMGIFEPRFIGACGSVMIGLAIPFFIPMDIRAKLEETIRDSRGRERELIDRINVLTQQARNKDGLS